MFSIFSYLFTFLAVLFWIFRAIATLLYQLDIEFFAKPMDVSFEIVLLFLTLPCLILVVKRNIVGAACYVGLYGIYFGQAIYNVFMNCEATGFDITSSSDLLLDCFGVLIPVFLFLDILFNKNRNLGNGNSKTDWYYKGEQYDRKFDDRADRNQYKF